MRYIEQRNKMGDLTMIKFEMPEPLVAEVKSELDADSCSSQESKERLRTALVYCEQLLFKNNYITTHHSAEIKDEHIQIGEKIYSKILEVLDENSLIDEDELISVEESDEKGLFHEVKSSISGSASDDEYKPDEENTKPDIDHVPLEYKIKIVNMAKSHPKWSLKTLQKKGGSRLKRMNQLTVWEKQITSGGTTKDKYKIIDSCTYNRFMKARQSNQLVTTRNLQQWGLAAASQLPELKFQASESWAQRFKQRHKIRQRTMKKYVPKRETTDIKETGNGLGL
ncbi:uncharacterized protein LOC124175377 [Neodiprion fabricii]|uniref:uncharacterized protein LOC124175377 n=1 Tax=Neodiprion fabricii TaxID=2872261 RepID=UPI001ED8C7CB|nr:uncharacterized protein LOC124175377 [Neodiprion fabricii]XP_046411536.1 uncharacterized protein LOC124175377 [Neodiprion fabricii]